MKSSGEFLNMMFACHIENESKDTQKQFKEPFEFKFNYQQIFVCHAVLTDLACLFNETAALFNVDKEKTIKIVMVIKTLDKKFKSIIDWFASLKNALADPEYAKKGNESYKHTIELSEQDVVLIQAALWNSQSDYYEAYR